MDRARYLRQQGLAGLAIERLTAMRVIVVGAGAVGNEVVKNLVLLGVGHVHVHDFDRVELHNLTRSVLLRETDVGASKAAAVAARAVELDPAVRVTAVEGDAWRTLTLGAVAQADVLICAVDNLEARMRLSLLARLAGTDLVNAGIDHRHVAVERFPFRAQPDCACYECHLPESAYRAVAQRYSCGWLRRALAAERTVATTTITASVAGALAVQAALRAGEAGAPIAAAASRRVLIDTVGGTSTVVALERNAECVGCGALQPAPRCVTAAGDWRAAFGRAAPDAAAVQLSDALVFDAACTACGPTPQTRAMIGRRADDYDDGALRCAQCGALAVRLDLRAEATVDDLAALPAAPPVKFLLAGLGGPHAVCIDLEKR